jgi:pimeloyl-ACP methyl ester carboxylesterase
MTTPRISGFTSEKARVAFLEAYEGAMRRLWPADLSADDIPTAFGTTRVYATGSGVPLVLLPGAGGNSLMWHQHVGVLRTRHRVLSIDPVGEPGGSTQTAAITGGPDVARWLGEVLDGLNVDRAHLVGCSYGGWTALQTELHGSGRAESITLLDPAGFGRISSRFLAWVILGGLAALTPRPIRHRAAGILHNVTLLDDDFAALGRTMIGFRRRLPVPPPLSDDELAAVGVPVLALFGQRSAMYDAQAVARRVRDVMPSARADVIEGASHDLPLYAPQRVAELITAFTETVPA